MRVNQPLFFSLVLAIGGFGNGKPNLNREAIFLDAPAFMQNKPQITAEENTRPLKINCHRMFHSNEISFHFRNKKQNLLKTEVYGYRDSRGFNYRFYAGKIFRIEDTSGYYRYVRESLPSSKRLKQLRVKQYRSLSPAGEISETNPERIK